MFQCRERQVQFWNVQVISCNLSFISSLSTQLWDRSTACTHGAFFLGSYPINRPTQSTIPRDGLWCNMRSLSLDGVFSLSLSVVGCGPLAYF